MPVPANRFKRAITAGSPQIGLWLNTAAAIPAEIAGRAGFDWLVIDGEHGPNDLSTIREQLQALSGSSAEPVVRPPMGETWMIKQLLDLGARTLLVPMVDTPEQARQLVRAMRYPPNGVRGVGAMVARASGFGAVPDYVESAEAELCLLVQIESLQAVENIESIAAIDGIDGLFIGPADLSADMGHRGRLDHQDVRATISDAITRIVATGKPAGILTFDEKLNRECLDLGATFVAVGGDVTEFAGALRRLAARYGRADAIDGPASY
ncbi:MAG: HpcH/HpaI aldolase/citrate lyase family protein [Neorhizobium sp.]|nr:HpcH/HpaI aldolase/citrate lyase family protein [Neorhizobium sp.]